MDVSLSSVSRQSSDQGKKKVQEEVKVNMLLIHNCTSFIWEDIQMAAKAENKAAI